MKKLIAMMTVAFAAVVLKADLVLYWNVNTEAARAAADYNYAFLYSANSQSTAGAWADPSSYLQGMKSTTTSAGTYTFTAPTTGDLFFYVALAQYDDGTITQIYKTTEVLAYNSSALSSHISTDGTPKTAWDGGTSYSVPEPTSGLLLLVGAAMLALKRKRA